MRDFDDKSGPLEACVSKMEPNRRDAIQAPSLKLRASSFEPQAPSIKRALDSKHKAPLWLQAL